MIQSLRKQFQVFSLLQRGSAVQVAPPHFNPAALLQLSPGQGLVVDVNIMGRESLQLKGAVTPCSSDGSSYVLRFHHTVAHEKRMIQAEFKFGSASVQTILLQDSTGTARGEKGGKNVKCNSVAIQDQPDGQQLVERADPVLSRAVAKAITPRPTILSFFSAAPKVSSDVASALPSVTSNSEPESRSHSECLSHLSKSGEMEKKRKVESTMIDFAVDESGFTDGTLKTSPATMSVGNLRASKRHGVPVKQSSAANKPEADLYFKRKVIGGKGGGTQADCAKTLSISAKTATGCSKDLGSADVDHGLGNSVCNSVFMDLTSDD